MSKPRNQFRDPNAVSVGCVVDIEFDFDKRRYREAVVTRVTDRTVSGNSPLIEYTPREEDRDPRKEKHGALPYACDTYYVKRVISRPSNMLRRDRNSFAECILSENLGKICDFFAHQNLPHGRRQYGSLYPALIAALASAPGTLVGDFSTTRFLDLWAKSGYRGAVRPFNVGSHDFMESRVVLNWKQFRDFVIVNRTRILKPMKQMVADGIHNRKLLSFEYEADMADPGDGNF